MKDLETRFVTQKAELDRPRLVILSGKAQGSEVAVDRVRFSIGAAIGNDVVLDGLAERHAELVRERDGLHFYDRSNGASKVNGSPIRECILFSGAVLNLAGVEILLQDSGDNLRVLPSPRDHFGPAKGQSLVMREIFGLLEAVSPTDATILLMGETGTGKDVVANAIHGASARRERPLQTLDCGAIAPALIESELFGYERGAFTGAEDRHIGAFERAEGGTLFLDEIGELPVDVQPKLLRAIDEREIRRVGGNEAVRVDVRIVAATKRDLLEEVKRGRFREDLWFRLAVVPITMPALRERREDIPLLVDTFVSRFEKQADVRSRIPPEEISRLQAHDWPGNVRELKNTVERGLWMAQTGDGEVRFMLPTLHDGAEALDDEPSFDPQVSFSDHKQSWEIAFERSYLTWLMARADGSLSRASRLASMDRKHCATSCANTELGADRNLRVDQRAGLGSARTPTVERRRMATLFMSMAGEGRGHATRTRALVELLRHRHTIRLFAPGNAYEILEPMYRGSDVRVSRIPGVNNAYSEDRRLDYLATGRVAAQYFAGLPKLVSWMSREIERESPDLAICDFEPALPRVARQVGLPYMVSTTSTSSS
ncbi:MAG: sigma 54-interacting transcriptional regulator [Myxococcales bacterium]|nr:sigma 54-interacting transcriptional regulator [Myxococcales bacterium]